MTAVEVLVLVIIQNAYEGPAFVFRRESTPEIGLNHISGQLQSKTPTEFLWAIPAFLVIHRPGAQKAPLAIFFLECCWFLFGPWGGRSVGLLEGVIGFFFGFYRQKKEVRKQRK